MTNTPPTMLAACLHGKLDVRLSEVPFPRIEKPTDVLIKVTHSGICGSDLHLIEGYELAKGETNAISTTTLGHECAGIVLEVGEAVRSVQPGQRVTAIPRGPCGCCELCRAGQSALCRKVTQRNGSWAQALVTTEALVYALPDDLPNAIGAITEPLACAVRIIDRCALKAGQNVCVIGAGPLGLLCAVLAKHSGAAHVIISDLRAGRLELARRMGIPHVVDASREDLREVVMKITNGRGVEVSIECVGLEPALSQAIDVVAVGGVVMWAGLAPTDLRVKLSPNDIFLREYTLRTSWGGVLEYERAIRLEQAIDWSPMVQERFPLERVMDAVHYARSQASGKVLLEMC